MAWIYNSLFKAPTALTLQTTLHSPHIGTAALGADWQKRGWQSESITPHTQPPASVHSFTGTQGNRRVEWLSQEHCDKDMAAAGFVPTTLKLLDNRLNLPSCSRPHLVSWTQDRWYRSDRRATLLLSPNKQQTWIWREKRGRRTQAVHCD